MTITLRFYSIAWFEDTSWCLMWTNMDSIVFFLLLCISSRSENTSWGLMWTNMDSIARFLLLLCPCPCSVAANMPSALLWISTINSCFTMTVSFFFCFFLLLSPCPCSVAANMPSALLWISTINSCFTMAVTFWSYKAWKWKYFFHSSKRTIFSFNTNELAIYSSFNELDSWCWNVYWVIYSSIFLSQASQFRYTIIIISLIKETTT